MIITKERTRLLFTEYTPLEHRKLEDLVASLDNVFMYYDADYNVIGMPTGMEQTIRKLFKDAKWIDKSKEHWDYARIQPVQHNAQPRNQLQIDFINFVLENSSKKQKLAGILSPGTGKEQPISTLIPSPRGGILMGNIKVGDVIFGHDGSQISVTAVYPQGEKDIYKITFDDGRTALCGLKHLWSVDTINELVFNNLVTLTLEELMLNLQSSNIEYFVPSFIDNSFSTYKMLKIEKIEFSHREEAKCIMVNDKYNLYVTEDNIITHNTFMACYSAIKVGLRTLIIVPTSGIKKQWGETLTDMFNVPPEKVKVVSKPKDFINVKEDFVVISQASLNVLNKTYNLEKIMQNNKFGIKVIDEVQMWFKNIINVDANSNIANNWYLTGTFGRSGDTENAIYQEMFGDLAIFREEEKKPTLFNRKPGNVYGMKPHMHVKMMWTHSGLSKEEIKEVTSSMRYSEREGKWIRYGISIPAYTELVIPSDGTMTKFLKNVLKVVESAEKEVKYGRTLILAATINACAVLASYVEKMFPDKKIGTINSYNSKTENDRVKDECDIIISTIKSCGTGFDVKDLAKLIVCDQYKSWILADQISGRLRRRPDGKDTYMWDFADADIKQLRAWANARADILRKKSKSFKVVDL